MFLALLAGALTSLKHPQPETVTGDIQEYGLGARLLQSQSDGFPTFTCPECPFRACPRHGPNDGVRLRCEFQSKAARYSDLIAATVPS